MRATRLPRLHVITDTRGPFAPIGGARPRGGAEASPEDAAGALATADSQNAAAFAVGASIGPLRDPLLVVAAALAAGARLIQVRPEDHYNDREAFDLATAIAALCDEYGALCLVNDRVHIAQAVGADGVHLGAQDLPVDAARRILPAASIIGGTSRDPESARAARRSGATYLGVGPVWGTTTKTGLPQPIGLEGLAAVCEAVDLPVIAIGGITAERAALCREVGAHGVAVVGAISTAVDPKQATAELLAAVGETSENESRQRRTALAAVSADRDAAPGNASGDHHREPSLPQTVPAPVSADLDVLPGNVNEGRRAEEPHSGPDSSRHIELQRGVDEA